MTSYMYNPSKKVTDILSKFFEFDPSELELGIWSGDLQLKNVKLRSDAIHPLLNRKANKPHSDPLTKAPLHMKLVSGTVGNMRIRIPWKRLVWGQGAVQLEISDVMIVLSMQSREETEEQRQRGLVQTRKKKAKKDTGNEVSKAYREAKQRRLREAERIHLQGLPLAIYLETLHRKNSIAREAQKVEEAAKSHHGSAKSSSKNKEPGKIDKWLKNVGSDLFWRFFAGIQGSITKARIVVVQDGVEVGCIVQSIEVVAGKDGTKVNINMADDDLEETSDEIKTPTVMTPPDNVAYEGAYDDGEYVDKSIKQQGLGLFIRKEVNMNKVPQALRFSTSVSADDYILRPVDMDLSFSFYYPYPPERRKKRALDGQSHDTITTAASTGVSGAASVGESTTTSSKQRRGKRDKNTHPNDPSPTPPPRSYSDSEHRRSITRSNSLNRARLTPMSAAESRLRNQHRRLGLDSQQHTGGRPQMQRMTSTRSFRSNTLHAASVDPMSVQESHAAFLERDMHVVPKFDCSVTMKEIRVVFTTRHYELLNYFLSTISRMTNGRPDQLIRSTPKETNTAAFHRKFVDHTVTAALPTFANTPKGQPSSIQPRKLNADILKAVLAPITGLRVSVAEDVEIGHDDSVADVDMEGTDHQHMQLRKSLRAQVVQKWWKYSIGAILWEIKKRKNLASNFRQMYISFDWNRQRYKRKEYIELYIAKKLDNRQDGVWPFEDGDKREDALLKIEDELPLEQILLYRSIARSIRVRGMTKMPDSIRDLHTSQSIKSREKRKKRPSNFEEKKNAEEETGQSSLLFLLQQKFDATSELRTASGLFKKFRAAAASQRNIMRSDLDSDLEDYDEDEVLTSDTARPKLPLQTQAKKQLYSSPSDMDPKTPSSKLSSTKQQRRDSTGNSFDGIQTGNFYSSGGTRKDSDRKDSDARTFRTFQKKDAKSSRPGQTTGSTDETVAKADERMKISIVLSIKLIDLMVVQEEYLFDISPEQLKRPGNSGRTSVGALSQDYYSGDEDSSSDEVSELSVLTDDQRFFSETGQVEPIAEEEDDDANAAKLSSTDFLLFGLPQDPLLRLTIESLSGSMRGRSGGRLNFGASIRRISALGDNGCHIFSMGTHDVATPVSEVDVGTAARRRSFDSLDLDLSTSFITRQGSGVSARGRGADSGRAISLILCIDEAYKDVQCDFSRILLTLDLMPASKLLQFYMRSEIKFPDRIVEKSSRDVARKFMVYKTTSRSSLKAINAIVRVHGLEIQVPLSVDSSDSSEASHVDASNSYDDDSLRSPVDTRPKAAWILSTDSMELYSGSPVDELTATAANDFGASRSSLFSGSVSNRKATPVKALEMLDILELTSSSDTFSCRHVVATMTSINCFCESSSGSIVKLLDIPVDVEALVTMNETSLLETDLPKNQLVFEVSPVHFLLSKHRLDMLTATRLSLDVSKFQTSTDLIKKKRKPDPPRIEILAPRILHSMDLSCRRVQVSLVKDMAGETETLTSKLKEIIMEECLSDFLSVVACFDFSLPNEEALSSAMQVCIGRLVGLGLSDDEAWGCTNAARLNFLDDISLMRRAQTDALVELSASIGRDPAMFKLPVHEEESEPGEASSAATDNSSDSSSVSRSETSEAEGPSIEIPNAEEFSDDDSAQSAEIVETTLRNAVEKTVATFAPLLQTYNNNHLKSLPLNLIVSIDMPLGFTMSSVKLFYDFHLALLVPSVIATNSAGLELLTLVPQDGGEQTSLDDKETNPAEAIRFSRYDLDEDHGFGKGGLPMSALAADDDEGAFVVRKRSRYDDIEIGELEILFSSNVYEIIIDEILRLKTRKEHGELAERGSKRTTDGSAKVDSSLVLTTTSLSVLFTSDKLTPFSRLTMERMAYRNAKGLPVGSFPMGIPSWLLVSENLSLQNLTPEGQCYPDTLTLLSPSRGDTDFPFQIHYFKSEDPWQESSRLNVHFNEFRLFLIRQFIHEILQFFVYERYGIGRLKKKYSTDIRDSHGNPKPPLLWSVQVQNASVICPRSSTSSDMAAFEVQLASIAVSYIYNTFRMPTESSPFDACPPGNNPRFNQFNETARRNSVLSTVSEYHECVEEQGSETSSDSETPVSAFSKDLKKRITIHLDKVRVFTVVAANRAARDAVESTVFRYFHVINGHAAHRKKVYVRRDDMDQQPSVSLEALKEVERFEQRWEEISTNLLDVEVFADYAPHMRLFIGSRHKPFTLDARMSQLYLLLSVWDNNMQEMPAMFTFSIEQVSQSATPPTVPSDFPSYGTEEFVTYLEDTSSTRSEICCIFKSISLRCTYDPPGFYSVDPRCFQYFDDPSCPDNQKPGVILSLDDAHIHVINDILNVRRIAIGTSFLELIDERRPEVFKKVLSTTRASSTRSGSSTNVWADVTWGLRNDVSSLNSNLSMPVLFTVFMSPGWSLINVGAQAANGIMHDLSWIWVLLDYFKSYYSDVAFGNPGHQAQRWTHKVKNALRKADGEEAVVFTPLPGVNVDFRLWLRRPILCIPSDYASPRAPCLRIDSETGLWYRYKSIRDLSSQEVSTTDLNLYFSNEFRAPENGRSSKIRDSMSGARALVEGLSFGLRYDSNNLCNHKDVSVLIPFAGEKAPNLDVVGSELEVDPIVLPKPVVCKPIKPLSRRLGPKVCEITCIIEILPATSGTMMNFFKGPVDLNQEFVVPEEDKGPVTFSVAAEVNDLRVFAIDPVLGVQLPVAVASVASLQLTATKFAGSYQDLNLNPGEAPPANLQLTLRSHLWADYFKLGMTRSWEPLIEPFAFLLMYEQATERGQGCFVEADTPFHINLSGAFLQSMGESLESFSALIKETFGEKLPSDQSIQRSMSLGSPGKNYLSAFIEDSIHSGDGTFVPVLHEIPRSLKSDDRVAFSLRNLTGQKIRIHQQNDHAIEKDMRRPAVVTYLNQGETMGLTFAATISVIKNLTIVEVPYPGLPNSAGNHEQQGALKHAVDVQVPGFRWIQGVKVDTFGRKFEMLIPRSAEVHMKMLRDWRLRNAMMLLTEVGLDSGGRLVTVRSLFEIRNNTSHPIKLVYDPDARRRPVESHEDHASEHVHETDTTLESSSVMSQNIITNAAEEIETIQPGCTFHIPTLLLERSLQMTGSHLGCLWLCPDTKDRRIPLFHFFGSIGTDDDDDVEASFSSRPIQLAKLVYESSLMFQQGTGADIPSENAKSGVQVSCRTRTKKGGSGAPFCYAIEVGRSPLVNVHRDKFEFESKESSHGEMRRVQKKKLGPDRKAKKAEERIHGPVAYSLSIHAPLVIVNLLPEGGRFELMHAIRKTVVWYADLHPGQQVPVHSVGLDAPLLLLVNLGFCRTPVGEGALVHHGADSVSVGRGEHATRFKSIGKAALKGTKQIGKTLTAISDSPDKRAQGRLAQISTPQFYNRQHRNDKLKYQHATALSNESLGLDTGNLDAASGKVHSVETMAYSQNDIATETTVVDGIGQRLTLNIENVRGGGGQRRVSLYCPYWIVNTTEHALRYKQDKGKSFVSGTVISRTKDGSKPVDGSNRNYRMHYRGSRRKTSHDVATHEQEKSDTSKAKSKTIFAGTPGALSTTGRPGQCDLEASELTKLIDRQMSLEEMAQIAFMFNFHEEGLSIGHQMLCVQMYDGSGTYDYSSEWSRGFSLESVAFSQIVVMNTKEGRSIELVTEVSVAPGFLSSYTKIVRFVPRYVVFNELERPIRLWQDSSIFRQVNEERVASTSDGNDVNKENRKWRYQHEDKNQSEKINQYESLFGRPCTIRDEGVRGVLPMPEGTTAHRSALYIKTVGASEMAPFLLPDTRAERQLRVDLGGIWNVSSSFAADEPGEYALRFSRATDLRLLSHVSTRAAPKYRIVLPPPDDSGIGEWDGELGVFFETDWGAEKRIIVKGTKRGRFAYNHTDIHVGDELLRIDGVSVARMSFAEAMKTIKERITQIRADKEQRRLQTAEHVRRQGVLRRISVGVVSKRRDSDLQSSDVEGNMPPAQLTLTFRTLEERLRKLRTRNGRGEPRPSRENERYSSNLTVDHRMQEGNENETINVEMKSINNTMFVILREPDAENPPFRIQNRSINQVVFYRQRGCEGHPWNFLFPGASRSYSWEEPMRSKKLTVRVAARSQDIFKVNAADTLSESTSGTDVEQVVETDVVASNETERQAARIARLRQALAYQYVDTEERGGYGPSITVLLEEIGFRAFLPIPSGDTGRKSMNRRKFLNCEVDTDGGTRLLIISDDTGHADDRNILSGHLETLKKQITYEEHRIAGLHSLQYLLSKEVAENGVGKQDMATERVEVIEADAKRFVEDFADDSTISSRNQVVVQVIAAVGLNASEFVGSCNPYCEIFLKGRSKSRQHFFQKRRNKRKTYFVERSLDPCWTDQSFVFDVPEEAMRVTRGHHILVKVRNFRLLGQHPILGQAAVHFGSLRNQQELVGWYPLAGRTGRSDMETVQLSDVSRGSIKLRVQWVYSTAALIDYFLLLSQNRLEHLSQSRDGMMVQLAHAIDSDERKRESKESVNSGRIQKLAKLERKAVHKIPSNSRRRKKRAAEKENVVGKLNQGLNSSLTVLKETLKASRDRYLYALYYQTAASKLNRQIEGDADNVSKHDDSVGESTNFSEQLVNSEPMSPSPPSGQLEEMRKVSAHVLPTSTRASMQSPVLLDKGQKTRQTLDDFFAKNPLSSESPFQQPKARLRVESGMSPRRLSRGRLDSENARRLVSHRRLSLDIDEMKGLVENGDQGHWRSAIFDNKFGQSAEWGISDLLSVGTDVDEEAKRKRNTRVLQNLGFVFHDFGDYFHEDHLSHHFRKALLSTTMGTRKGSRLYQPKFAVGSPSTIRHFKTYQAAGAVHIDPEIEVTATETSFILSLKRRQHHVQPKRRVSEESKQFIITALQVPDEAPATTKSRSEDRLEKLFSSRTSFERMVVRTLGAVLNPGGWLTVRPITALNLPDGYNGMFVRLRYGSDLLVSETVDAKVTPRWGSLDIMEEVVTPPDGKERRPSSTKIADNDFSFTENDLHVRVEPQQTSGLIKISVVAEKMNTKNELGVVEIPLGSAIAACLHDDDDDDNENDVESSFKSRRPQSYLKWFPLMSPRLAIPVEGDMGISSRPTETEKSRDSMFQQYFTPCIQLALMWWPDNNELEDGDQNDAATGEQAMSMKLPGPNIHSNVMTVPKVQSYFNLDISHIGAALIDSQRAAELLSFNAMDIDVRYSVTKTKTRIGLVVGWIQLDHQDPRAREPVVLAPTPTDAMQPALQILALKDNLRTKSNIVSYEYIGVALREMDLTVEESWIFELWEFFMSVMRRRKAKRNTAMGQQRADFLLTTHNCFAANDQEEPKNESLLSVLNDGGEGQAQNRRRKIYIEQLILGLVKVNLSYVKGKKQSFELTDKGAKALRNFEMREIPNLALAVTGISLSENALRGDQSEVFLKWSQLTYDEDVMEGNGYNLPGIIAAVFPSVSDAPIRLQGKVLDHVFRSSDEIVSNIKTFYVNETLKQVYKIIGSLDFVGNPTILFSSFVSGVRDLVAAPTSAFLKSPTNVNQVGLAVGKGTLSLFSHSASGIFGFAAKMSATAGQAAAILSLDAEYSQWHRDRIVTEATNLNRVWKRRGIQSVPEMLTRPIGDIIMGVAMGASGFLISPYKGFKEGGGLGFVRGCAVGTAGVVAKPLVGVLDAFTHFSATIHDVAKSVNVLERRYQPALKLRLPYTFGPRNILSPFDPVAARSVYLLRQFPPKNKRNQRIKRADEIHVHSEILHMEPGVDTYAIATTIRVVLVRLKKDVTGGLLPALGWEVELADQGSVSSRVSDHGHNGVALTITRRTVDDKATSEPKDLKVKITTKRPLESLKSPTFSSALSMDSGFSDLEDEDDDMDVNGEAIAETPQDDQVQGEDHESNEADPTFDHGATKKGGEVLRWFTVLAEYNHRRQLTALHNAVSALVGDFDAIIADRGLEVHGGKEGITTFGIFMFERPASDHKSGFASNAELVASLERLPWMHEDLFSQIKKYPAKKRADIVTAIRQNWTFSMDLEGSKKEGGPTWFVEARARAMFSDSNGPILHDFLDPNDPVVREVMVGNDRAERANLHTKGKSVESMDDSEGDKSVLSESERSISIKGLESNASYDESKNSYQHCDPPLPLSGDAISSIQLQRLKSRSNSEDDLFHSVEFHDSVLGKNASDVFMDVEDKMETPMQSASSIDNQELKSLQSYHEGEHPKSLSLPSDDHFPRFPIGVTTRDREASRIDRMERMETLMEQLVIINAQQVQKFAAPAEMSGDVHALADSKIADVLKQEVAELRLQVRARAEEDDALRNEIMLLRHQLAERREQRNTKIHERPAGGRLKIPELLRFGISSRKEDDIENVQSDDDNKGVELQNTSAEFFETQLNDEPQEPRSATRQGILLSRAPGRTFTVNELIPPQEMTKEKRTVVVDHKAIPTPGSGVRLPLPESAATGVASRRGSMGSGGVTRRGSTGSGMDGRLSGRRMSGEHQVRWE